MNWKCAHIKDFDVQNKYYIMHTRSAKLQISNSIRIILISQNQSSFIQDSTNFLLILSVFVLIPILLLGRIGKFYPDSSV